MISCKLMWYIYHAYLNAFLIYIWNIHHYCMKGILIRIYDKYFYASIHHLNMLYNLYMMIEQCICFLIVSVLICMISIYFSCRLSSLLDMTSNWEDRLILGNLGYIFHNMKYKGHSIPSRKINVCIVCIWLGNSCMFQRKGMILLDKFVYYINIYFKWDRNQCCI